MKLERYKEGVRIYLTRHEVRGVKAGLERVCEFYYFPVCHRLYELMKYACYQPKAKLDGDDLATAGKNIKTLLEGK